VAVRRAVSLVPSATDTAIALGAGGALVGISADCDQPEPASPRPVVTRPMIDPAAAADDPAGVDAAVRLQLAAGGLLYELDVDQVVALAPDVVFAQDSCSVCALPSSEVVAVLSRVGLACDVVSLDPADLEGVLATFPLVGRALGLEGAGMELEATCRARLDALGGAGSRAGGSAEADGPRSDGDVSDSHAPRPRVLVLDWVDPPFVAGNWVPDLVKLAGGEPVLAAAGAPSRQISWEEASSCQPELVVVAPCGLDLEAATPAAVEASEHLGAARVVAFDGRVWFSRPGPRLVEGAEALAAWLCGAQPTSGVTSIEITEANR
jgi:iron complex transport system substrate-binding protein